MPQMPRTIVCDVCQLLAVEPSLGAGWNGWGMLQGIEFNGAPNPMLCPDCLAKVAATMDEMRSK